MDSLLVKSDAKMASTRSFPVTPMQEAMVVRTLMAPDQGDYVQQLLWSWQGPFQAERFAQTWSILADRHEGLRSWFRPETDGRVALIIDPKVSIPIQTYQVKNRKGAVVRASLDEECRRDRGIQWIPHR